ncbi:MAG TPA: 3-phosphoshikimate 1-carboxyvinyltransferase [Candidatus Acidoferrales bacterium]|nr:3-phosphoshikimate 1-carboxyvinyltransferase [Candidatus Acidoferrales bacterium]
MAKKIIAPGGTVSGVLELPGDKSISHRYAILAALAEGTSEIFNYASAADCRSTLECLRRLGVQIDVTKDRARVAGVGLGGLKAPRRALDAENSGSTIRMLAGVLAGQPFKSTLTGDSSLRKRPMRRIVEPLRQMGAGIHTESRTSSAQDESYRAPLEIQGGKLRAIDYTTPVPSAQVKSAILLAGLYADGVTTVRESVRTRDHTELALREFGATVDVEKGLARIHPRPKLQARQLTVPGDLSAAVFMIGAALVLPGSELMLHNVGLNPTRTRVLDFLISIGASINIASVQLRDGELVGDVAVRHAPLSGGSISGAQVAEMIDELPMLAALGPYTEKGIEIRDAKELRVKESDRIAALAEGLRQMGATVEEFPDGLRVAGRSEAKLHGAKVDPQGDHRIAMALGVAALGAEGNTTIRDADCAAVSFPEFFTKLEHLRGKS